MGRVLGWLILGGGLLVLIFRALAPKEAAPPTAPSSASRADSLESAIDAAKKAAATIRGEVGGDSLVASLLKIDPATLSGFASPDNQAKIKDLQSQIVEQQNALSNAKMQYKINHNGGQSEEEEAAAEARIVNAINDLTAQLAKLS